MSDTLSSRAVRGASVTVGGQGARFICQIVTTAVLARLVSPEDFGLMAIVLSVVAFGELVRDFGLSLAVARTTTLSQSEKSNLFWLNGIIGITLAGLVMAIATPISAVFGELAIAKMMFAISPFFILTGFSTQFRAELNRKLRFAALTVCDTAPVLMGAVAAIIVATWTPTFWALVAQQLIFALSGLALAVALARWRPGRPRRVSIRKFINFAAPLFGTQVVAYFTKNIDNLTIGYYWGSSALGIYSRAYQLLMVPLNQFAAPLTRVVVPILSRVASDDERFHRYLREIQAIASVGISSIYGALIGLANPLVLLIFGQSWITMVPVFQALAVGGIFRGLSQVTFWVFLAKGKSREQLHYYLLGQPVIIVAMLIGLQWGIVGVAVGHSFGYFLNWMLGLWWCAKKTQTNTTVLLHRAALNTVIFALPSGLLGVMAIHLVLGPLSQIGLALGLGACCVAAGFALIPKARVHARHLYSYVARRKTAVIKETESRADAASTEGVVVVVPWLEGGGAQRALAGILGEIRRRSTVQLSLVVLFKGSRNYQDLLKLVDSAEFYSAPRSLRGVFTILTRIRLRLRSASAVYSLMRASHVVLGIACVGVLRERPFAASFHQLPSTDSTGLTGRLEDVFVRQAMHAADIVTTPSSRARAQIVANRFTISSRCVVEQNIILPLQSRGHPGIRTGTLERVRLVFAGRLTRQKGLDLIPSLLEKTDIPVELRILGDGEEREWLERLLVQVPDQHKVRFIGRTDDVSEHLAWADAAFMPSRSELNPVFVWEAWQQGLAVITSPLDVFYDLAAIGPIWVFEDSASFGELISSLSKDSRERQRAQEAGLEATRVTARESKIAHFLSQAAEKRERED